MTSDLALYLPLLIAGAFAAAFVIGAVGFADALILNAVWLHIMEPARAIPLIVTCGIFMHIAPLFKLRKTLDFSKLPPFAIAGVLGVPLGVWALNLISLEWFKMAIGALLLVYGVKMLVFPKASVGTWGGRVADTLIGFGGGFMGGFAGLSGLLPTVWADARNWAKNTQRGVFQPFVLLMHALGIITFAINGMITMQVLQDLAWCLPVIVVGSWLGTKVYPYLDDKLFRRIILSLILISGITLLI